MSTRHELSAVELKLLCFERKVLKKIYGPLLDSYTKKYKVRTNEELRKLYNDPNIVHEIKFLFNE